MSQTGPEGTDLPTSPADASRAGPGMAGILKFVVPTLLGMSMFLIPVPSGESITIGIGVLSDALTALLGDAIVPLGVVVICLSVVVTLVARVANPAWMNAEVWREIFHVGPLWLGMRVVGAVFALMTLYEFGPEFIRGAATGSVILNDLIPVLLTFFLFALAMLPFLTEFGLMEFIGTIVRKPFRKIFGLPGRSAIDATASWMGAAPLGVLITYQQYERGYYSQREASVIATNFSVASIAFSLLIAGFIELDHMFVQMYFTVVVAGLIAAVIMPRISGFETTTT